MANSNGWGDGAANNSIGWGKCANNAIGWGDSQEVSWAGLTDIVGIVTDADAQAFVAAAGIVNPVQQSAIDNLVSGLKSDGIWTKMKAIYPFVGGTASAHKWNLKDPRDLDAAFRLVFNGGWTHSSTGALPNGTNAFADTKFTPSTSFSANNSSFGVYSRTNNVNGENFMGTSTAITNRIFMYVRFTSGGACQFNHNSQSFANPTAASSSGQFVSNRISAGTHKVFYNGSILTTSSTPELGLSSVPIFISSANASGSASGFSNRQLAFAHVGDGLTDTEAANLYTRVQAFQTALSRNV